MRRKSALNLGNSGRTSPRPIPLDPPSGNMFESLELVVAGAERALPAIRQYSRGSRSAKAGKRSSRKRKACGGRSSFPRLTIVFLGLRDARHQTRRPTRRFQLILIKPSHYDADGYVVQWLRSTMPSNSLAAVFSLANGAAERAAAWPRSSDRRHRHGRDQHPRRAARNRAPHRRQWRARPRRHHRRAVERIPPRRGYRPAAARGRRPGDDRRLPRLGLPVDAEGDSRRHQGRRRRSASRSSPARPRKRLDEVIDGRRARRADAALRSHEAPAGHRRHRLAALPALRLRQAHHRQRDELRCRPRLPLPMLVLHHHQRAGTQVALSLAGQRRADPAHELGAGRQPLLHHRRQFRPQQGLGSDLRPHHQAARRGRHGRPLHDPGRHAVPPDPELHREIEAAPASPACSSGSRTSTPRI